MAEEQGHAVDPKDLLHEGFAARVAPAQSLTDALRKDAGHGVTAPAR
jgi:hypothetical protein